MCSPHCCTDRSQTLFIMKLLALIIFMAAAAMALPARSRGHTSLSFLTKFKQRTPAKGLLGFSQLPDIHIPKRDAAPVISVPTKGVQGGEVVERDAEAGNDLGFAKREAEVEKRDRNRNFELLTKPGLQSVNAGKPTSPVRGVSVLGLPLGGILKE